MTTGWREGERRVSDCRGDGDGGGWVLVVVEVEVVAEEVRLLHALQLCPLHRQKWTKLDRTMTPRSDLFVTK